MSSPSTSSSLIRAQRLFGHVASSASPSTAAAAAPTAADRTPQVHRAKLEEYKQKHVSSGGSSGSDSSKQEQQPSLTVLSTLPKHSLKGQTVFITGASRGIGLAIGLKAAKDGANVVIVAKTVTEDPRLPGTIYTAAEEIKKAGGKALAVQCDIRSEEQVTAAVKAAVDTFGGIDILINNASAIHLTGTEGTPMKRYDLMHHINTRGTFMVSQKCLPYLRKSKNPHIINISPPLNMVEKWFAPHVAYTMAKFGMSMCVLGMSGEFRGVVGVNALWPRTTIATAAVSNLLGGTDMVSKSRTAEIMADAAYEILIRPGAKITGNFFIDEDVMRAVGVKQFDKYAVVPGTPDSELAPDFFC